MAGAVAIYALLSFFVRPFARSSGAILVTLAALATQMASGYLWSEMPLWTAASIAIASLIAWAIVLPPLAKRSRWIAVTIALLLAAIPASLVVGKYAAAAAKATAEDTGGGSSEEDIWK